jgi:hypothetical protein
LGTSPNLSVQYETYCSVEALPVGNVEFAAERDDVVIFFDARGVARDGKLYQNTYA